MQFNWKVINDALPQLNTHMNMVMVFKCINVILDYKPHIWLCSGHEIIVKEYLGLSQPYLC